MTAAVRGFIGAAGVNFTPGISGTVILVLLLLLLISYIALRLLRLRAERLRRDLEEEKQARAELASFLSRFSTGLRGDRGFDAVMHTTAMNVAEKVDAESLCIYEFRNEELTGAGIFGN